MQFLEGFESVLNGFMRIPNVDVYVIDSNAKLLSKDIINEFRGRGDELHMNPLSFAEFMSVYEGNKYDGWKEYLLYRIVQCIDEMYKCNRSVESN